MKHLQYPIIGALIGLIAGAFFGLIFDSFYTKKSERAAKQQLQVYVFGGLGMIVGFRLGMKISKEEEEKTQKQIAYQNSLVEKSCEFCNLLFQYSTLEFTDKKYCESCIEKIKTDYTSKFIEINKIVKGIDLLKQRSAINNRLAKARLIAESLSPYEDVELSFISKKPSAILKSFEDYLNQLGQK